MARADKRKSFETKLAVDTWDSRRSLPNKNTKNQNAENLYGSDGSIGHSKEKEGVMAPFLKNVLWTRKTGEIPQLLENLILENPSSWLTRPFEVKELRWPSRRLKHKKSDKP